MSPATMMGPEMDNQRKPDATDQDLSVPSVDPRLDKLVGEKLRKYFDSLMDAPVPDRILDLISALDAKERNSNDGSAQ